MSIFLTVICRRTYSLKIFQGPAPIAEDEKKNAESMTSQDNAEKRPETDFHFFSDSEVTKYVIYISCLH